MAMNSVGNGQEPNTVNKIDLLPIEKGSYTTFQNARSCQYSSDRPSRGANGLSFSVKHLSEERSRAEPWTAAG